MAYWPDRAAKFAVYASYLWDHSLEGWSAVILVTSLPAEIQCYGYSLKSDRLIFTPLMLRFAAMSFVGHDTIDIQTFETE